MPFTKWFGLSRPWPAGRLHGSARRVAGGSTKPKRVPALCFGKDVFAKCGRLVNKAELRAAIIGYGIRPDAYNLEGEACNECYVLRYEDGAWVVFYSERGYRRDPRSFGSEAAACEHMLNILLQDSLTRRR
jgi:hypothetical protein